MQISHGVSSQVGFPLTSPKAINLMFNDTMFPNLSYTILCCIFLTTHLILFKFKPIENIESLGFIMVELKQFLWVDLSSQKRTAKVKLDKGVLCFIYQEKRETLESGILLPSRTRRAATRVQNLLYYQFCIARLLFSLLNFLLSWSISCKSIDLNTMDFGMWPTDTLGMYVIVDVV